MRLLIVEDDLSLLTSLSKILSPQFIVDEATNLADARNFIHQNNYSIIVLDYLLPDGTGIDLTRFVRQLDIDTYILFLTGQAELEVKVEALETGADDYLTKPFYSQELLARLKALQRRLPTINPSIVNFGPLTLNLDTLNAAHNGTQINLRRKEFFILKALMLAKGSIVTRSMLKDLAWETGQENYTNTVDVHIKYLRDKIDKPFGTKLIKTVHGLGYRLSYTS